MPRRKPKHTLLSAGASLIGTGLIFLLLPGMLGTRLVMKAVGEGLRMPGWSALGVGVVLLALHWLVRQCRGNWGQRKILTISRSTTPSWPCAAASRAGGPTSLRFMRRWPMIGRCSTSLTPAKPV